MGWIRLTPAGEEEGHLFTAYNYTDHRHNLNKAYQLDDETPIYILDDVGIALPDAELAAIPPVKALVEALQSISIMQTPDIMREVARQALAPFEAAE